MKPGREYPLIYIVKGRGPLCLSTSKIPRQTFELPLSRCWVQDWHDQGKDLRLMAAGGVTKNLHEWINSQRTTLTQRHKFKPKKLLCYYGQHQVGFESGRGSLLWWKTLKDIWHMAYPAVVQVPTCFHPWQAIWAVNWSTESPTSPEISWMPPTWVCASLCCLQPPKLTTNSWQFP